MMEIYYDPQGTEERRSSRWEPAFCGSSRGRDMAEAVNGEPEAVGGGEHMKILISPAKKMRTDTDTLSPRPCPPFSPETERLLSTLRSLSRQELKQLWRCSDASLI